MDLKHFFLITEGHRLVKAAIFIIKNIMLIFFKRNNGSNNKTVDKAEFK